MPGWNETTEGAKALDDLPANARAYLDRIEETCGVPIAIVSTGPDREHTMVIDQLF
jgi:adenylosuccinate synthase